MMRSMFSGVSGLRAHQTKMDVIGNNIANVNTVGFKASSVTFTDVFSQTVKGAGSPQEGRGGTNPQQIGLGSGVAAITVNHGKGSSQRTNNATDLMIDGNGFFMVTADANAQNVFYTRAGNFSVDQDGYMVTPEGFKLLDTDLKPVQINKSATKAATKTTGVILSGNLNSNSTEDYTTTLDAYDSLGNTNTLSIKLGGTALKMSTTIDTVANDPRYDTTLTPTTQTQRKYSYREIDITATGATSLPANTGTDQLYAQINDIGDVVDIVKFAANPPDITTVPTSAAAAFTLVIAGAQDVSLTVDRNIFFENNDPTKDALFTSTAQDTDLTAKTKDGNSAGSISSFNISSSGEVVTIFTNGERASGDELKTIG
ncbi:MAG: flagellar hook-basal body complex protein, partial [Acidaminobacteraceae bacterium]